MRAPPPGSGPFGHDLGMYLLDDDQPGARVAIDLDARHQREGGIVHGGVIMALLDSAMAAAVRRETAPEEWIASIQIDTSFVAAAKEGRLVAEGTLQKRTRSTAFVTGRLVGPDGSLVATAQGIWAIRTR